MTYALDFAVDDRDPLQQRLNALYDYADDIPTKVLHRSRLNLFHVLLADLIRGGVIVNRRSALDVGCNAGVYSKMISDAGFRDVLGVDIEAQYVARARGAFAVVSPERTIAFEVANAEELDLSRSYDLVLCTEVIEHTARPERVVGNLSRLVAPGGVAVVTLPNRFSLPFLVAEAIYRVRRKARNAEFEDHLRWPFWRSQRVFRGTRLERVRTTGTNLFLDDHVLAALYRTPLFPAVNRLNFELSRRWPLHYASQFFFMVFRATDG